MIVLKQCKFGFQGSMDYFKTSSLFLFWRGKFFVFSRESKSTITGIKEELAEGSSSCPWS